MTSVQSGLDPAFWIGSRIRISLGLVELCVLAVFGCTSYWVLGYYINKPKMMSICWLLDYCKDNSLGSLNSKACGLPSQIFVFTEYSAVFKHSLSSVQFSSVAQSCPTLCDPVDCSMTGFPVGYRLPEFTQTHDSDAIQPSHPLSSPSPTFNPSQYQGLFQ